MKRDLTVVYCMFVIICLAMTGASSRGGMAADPLEGWGEPVMIESEDADSATAPELAVAPNGDAFAVWEQWDGVQHSIFACRYAAGEGWDAVERVETNDTHMATNPAVAVDGQGGAMVAWVQSDGMNFDLWSNRYVAGVGWGSPELAEDYADTVGTFSLDVDASGNATVAFWRYDGFHQVMCANRYVADEGWGSPEQIADGVGDDDYPSVGMDGAGNAVVVWQRYGGSLWDLWSNAYVAGEGWGTPGAIETDDYGDVGGCRLAVADSGDATAVWVQWDTSRYNIWSNNYKAGEGWDVAQLLETDDAGDAYSIGLAGDGAGNAVAVWQQYDGAAYSAMSSRYVAGVGWDAPVAIENSTQDILGPKVALDQAGNATAVWLEMSGPYRSLFSSRYSPSEGWGAAELAESDDTMTVSSPQVGADSSGNVVAVWLMDDGVRDNVWANRYISPDIVPPEVSIDSPTDGLTTGSPTVTVSGTTEPGATVSVNGVYVVVDAGGAFSFVLALLEGENVITANATDPSGNSAEASVTVTYVNPVHELEAQLESALAEIAFLQAYLDGALDNVTYLESQLGDALEDIDELQAQLDVTMAYATALEGQLDEVERDLVNTSATLNETLVDLEYTEADLAEALEAIDLMQAQLDAALAGLTSAEEDLAQALEDLAALQEELDVVRDDLAGTDDDLDDAESMNTVLSVALVAALALAALMAVMYLRTRTKGPAA